MTSSRKFAIRRPGRERAAPPGAPPASLVVGKLVGPHGVTGELKLRPLTDHPERLERLTRLLLRFPDGEEASYPVLGRRWHKEMLLVRLDGVLDRDAAEALRDAEVLIPVEEAAPLPEGRYYEHQILGLRVVTPDGEELGRVTEIMNLPSNDVYVAGDLLIPATHDAIERLDPSAGVIVVRSREYLEGEEVR